MQPDKPVFDFSDFSGKDQRVFGAMSIQLFKVSQAIDSVDSDDPRLETLLAQMDTLTVKVLTVVGKCLVSVPKAWLVKSAPKSVNWCEDDAIGCYVQAPYIKSINEAFRAALAPESVEGNSEGQSG